MALVFYGIDDYKKLDFIACWFYLGSRYIKNYNSKYSFVTTNSICQGEQVAILWPSILNNELQIEFAYQSFKWKNNAKAVAGVTVVIIGIGNQSKIERKLFINERYTLVKEINAYLVASVNTFVNIQSKPLSSLPEMIKGCSPGDGGSLILSAQEAAEIIESNTNAKLFIKKYLGADEFLYDKLRYCIWVDKSNVELINILGLDNI